MKRLFVLLGALACGLVLAAPPNGLTNRNVARIASAERGGGAAGGGGSLLVNENFEGTGTPTGWTVLSGSPDFDNTSSPLAGSQDFKTAAGVLADTKVDFTASDEIWIQVKFSQSIIDQNSFLFVEAGAQYYGIKIDASSKLQLIQSGSDVGSATVTSVSFATPLWIFFHVKKGSGANALVDVEFSTTSTRTGSGNTFTSYTSGTVTNQFVDCELYHAAAVAADVHYDDLKISNTGWPP